jgi:hypothetical protein
VKVDQALAAALVDSLAEVRYLEEVAREPGKVTMRLKVLDPQGRLLAGLELGRGGSGELLGRKLNGSRVFRLGEDFKRKLPGPWALDN